MAARGWCDSNVDGAASEPVLDAPVRRRLDPWLDAVGRRLAAAGVSADALTLAGFLAGLAAVAAVALGAYRGGLALFLLGRLLDGLDGAVARARGITDRGGFLDIVLDFLVYAGMAFAFALADPAVNALAAAFLLFAFMGTGSTFLAFAAMAARRGLETRARGRKSLYYLGGLTEGTETILFFTAACLWPAHFVPLALTFAGLCWITTAARILVGCRLLGDAGGRR